MSEALPDPAAPSTMANPQLTSTHLDLPALLSADFNPYTHASSLVQKTTAPSDPPPTDLTTPLSRALFDAQEVDSLIHALTSRSAVPILTYTQTHNDAAQRIQTSVDAELGRLNDGFERLEREVVGKWERAEAMRKGAERGVELVRLVRGLQRVVGIARGLETAIVDSALGVPGKSGREDYRALMRATYAILAFREIMFGPEAAELARVNLVRQIRGRVFEDTEEKVRDWAKRAVREFSIASLAATVSTVATATVAGTTFRDTEDAKARFTVATHILYLLSPTPRIDGRKMRSEEFEPELLTRALQTYLHNAVTASTGAIARALAALPQLERALGEVSVRCQTLVGMEMVLSGIERVEHPLLDEGHQVDADGEDGEFKRGNLLQPFLHALDTESLPSAFWRSLAEGISPKVQDIMNRGGVAARTLRTNRDRVKDEIRECVHRGSRMPAGILGTGDRRAATRSWEREAGLMAHTVVGSLGR